MPIQPIGSLIRYNGDEFHYVNCTRIGKRRLYEDEVGNLFVKIYGKWWKFPESVEY